MGARTGHMPTRAAHRWIDRRQRGRRTWTAFIRLVRCRLHNATVCTVTAPVAPLATASPSPATCLTPFKRRACVPPHNAVSAARVLLSRTSSFSSSFLAPFTPSSFPSFPAPPPAPAFRHLLRISFQGAWHSTAVPPATALRRTPGHHDGWHR